MAYLSTVKLVCDKVVKMLVVAVNLAKNFLKVISPLMKKRQQGPVTLITQEKILKRFRYTVLVKILNHMSIICIYLVKSS